MGTPGSMDALRAFLADRDQPCPGCGYNLRGVEQPQCPECGQSIALEVVGRRDRWALWFVLLTLGWVLIASGMNGARAGLEVWRQANPAQQVMMLGTPLLPRLATPPGTQTSTTFGSGGGMTFRSSTTITINRGTLTLGAAPAAGPAWGNVSTISWVTLGWWAVLFIAAAQFLLLAWFVVRRRGTERVAMLGQTAAFVFACYAGFHLVMFVREIS